MIAHCAATMSASELSRLLDMTDRKGRSALALAAEANASEYVDLLVENGATLSSSSSLLEPDNQALYDISESYLTPSERTQEATGSAGDSGLKSPGLLSMANRATRRLADGRTSELFEQRH